jgi:hypothetical protein
VFRVTATIGAGIGALAVVFNVWADDPQPGDSGTPAENMEGVTTSVESNDNGVTIYIGIADTSPGGSVDNSSGGVGNGGDYSSWSCTSDVMNIGQASLEWFQEESAKHPGEAPWIVRCNDEFISIVWLPINTDPVDVVIVVGPAEPVDPVSIAAELRDHLPVPQASISANPDVGLVALPSWFWIDGYDGSPIQASDSLGGVTVEVEISPQQYRWSFGDGATLETTSHGSPYPAESDIQHSYEQSSLATAAGFPVTVEINFSARYRVNDGDWQALEPISRSFSRDYPVQQLQAVLTGD